MSRSVKKIVKGVPNDTGESFLSIDNVKDFNPFVLFDHLYVSNRFSNASFIFNGHPRVATITYPLVGLVEFKDAFGNVVRLGAGGVDVNFSGDGEWHKDTVVPNDGIAEILRLWVVAPDENEVGIDTISLSSRADAPIIPEKKTIFGVTKVLIGEFDDILSSIIPPAEMDFFHVTLFSGCFWKYQVSAGQTTTFIFVRNGVIVVDDNEIIAGEMALLESNTDLIMVHSVEFDSEFFLISGVPMELKSLRAEIR